MIFDSPDNKLHYDLSFLLPGETNIWPPKEDARRLDKYRFAREEFELTPESLISSIVPKGLLDLRSFDDFTHSVRLLAYPRLLTLKTIDMIFGQPPLISAQAIDAMTEKIKDMRVNSQFNDRFTEGIIDYSRFGVLVMRVYKDENGRAQITAWDPNEWVPVYYNDGTRRIHYNVIGWRVSDSKVVMQIHDTSDGSYEEREYLADSTGALLSILSAKKYNVTSGKKLLFAVANTPTTTCPIGTSDYEIINSLIQKAVERLKAILRVLDEHADPSMTGPYSLLSKAENSDELVFKTSKYYAVGEKEQKPEYLVWEANLDSSFKAFEELCHQIYILSEMGEAFLGASGGTGNVVSGTAMRFKMISPLEKARRMTNKLDGPIREIVSSMMFLSGETIEPKDINVDWKDSLPKDPRELAELAKLEAGSVAIKPLLHAIMDNYGVDEETAKHYVEGILADQKEFSILKSNANTPKNDPSKKPVSSKKGGDIDPAQTTNGGSDKRSEMKDAAVDK